MKQWIISICLLIAATAAQSESLPRAEIKTSMGTIVIELDPNKAPHSVENFISYAKEGFYEGTVFHRVIKDFMIQGGGYSPDLQKKPTHPAIVNEAQNGLKNLRGTVAMARVSDPNSATAQFFINVKDNANLDFKDATPAGAGYSVFGKVVQGLEVVDAIQHVETGAGGSFSKDVPITPVVIEKITLKNVPASLGKVEAKKAAEAVVKAEPVKTEQAKETKAEVKEAVKTPEPVKPEVAKAAPKAEPAKVEKPAESKPEASMSALAKPNTAVAEVKDPAPKKVSTPAKKSAQPAPDKPTSPDKPEPSPTN
ncbi:MAG: peptidylprolyl isomerase [Thiotrichaceae bacterium]|nr:peptidylprolyl isomerase [Thiotrichaceae bacterium]